MSLQKSAVNTESLLVEGREINQQAAVNLMKKMGCNTAVATNGQEAWYTVENKHFDIFFFWIYKCQLWEVLKPHVL